MSASSPGEPQADVIDPLERMKRNRARLAGAQRRRQWTSTRNGKFSRWTLVRSLGGDALGAATARHPMLAIGGAFAAGVLLVGTGRLLFRAPLLTALLARLVVPVAVQYVSAALAGRTAARATTASQPGSQTGPQTVMQPAGAPVAAAAAETGTPSLFPTAQTAVPASRQFR